MTAVATAIIATEWPVFHREMSCCKDRLAVVMAPVRASGPVGIIAP